MFISAAGGEPSAVLHAPATSGQCLQRKRKLDQIGSGYSGTASSYTVTATAVPAQTLAAKHLSHQAGSLYSDGVTLSQSKPQQQQQQQPQQQQ